MNRPVFAPEPGDAMRTAVLVAALIWVLVIFNIVPEGLDYGALENMPSRGSTVSRLIWLALLGTGLLVVLWRNALSLALVRATNPFLLALLALAIASIAWSVDPDVTIRRLVRLLAIFSCAYCLVVVHWHNRRFQGVLRPVLTLMLVASLAFGILEPDLAIPPSTQAELAGAWRGLATHKNGFGSLASLGTIIWMHALLARETRALTALAGVVLSATCLYLSRSSTSILATGVAVALLILVLRSPAGLRRAAPLVVRAAVAVILVYSLAVLQVVPGLQALLEPITAITGKDLTFTGRTALWELLRERISQHLYLGGGFGAYWGGPVPWSQSFEFVIRLNFYPGQAHNGYLDVMNDLGLVGVTLLLGYLVVYLWQSLRLMALDRTQGALYLALLFQQLISNLSESRWWNVLSVEFVILTIATVAMARDLLESRLRATVAQAQK
jgi:O-antigen ligase